MNIDLTTSKISKSILLFSLPMICGNILQQFYNIADTLIVGKYIGPSALAAVGSSFTLMTFLTSILIGLCMGSGIIFSMLYGAKNENKLKSSYIVSFIFIGILSIIITICILIFLNPILTILQIPDELLHDTKEYLQIISIGIIFVFLYNFFSVLLRSIGNSTTPLYFLAFSTVLNIILDILFVAYFNLGIDGAAYATILSQALSAILIMIYSFYKIPELHIQRKEFNFTLQLLKEIIQFSLLTSIQQSIMNFGILMIQSLINSFGISVMAAYAAAVKIDSFAYMPAQDFGNAFSTFIAQNLGARKTDRITLGIRSSCKTVLIFCLAISILVFVFAPQLMLLFIAPEETEILAIGITYLRIEGACYCGIGLLFLFYGYFRGIGRPGISILLTVLSLGSRVILAYALSPIKQIGLYGIWWAIPIGWILSDIVGFYYYKKINIEDYKRNHSLTTS